MKKILLTFLLIASVHSIFGQTKLPCVIEYRINNGGGNCPDTVINGETITATGSVTLTFEGTITPDNIPKITFVKEAPPIDTLITGITFGSGTLNANGTVTYCYYVGPNNNNNLNGQNRNFTFGVFFGTRPACTELIPTPVTFKSFTAARNRSNVTVKWETASEQNNSGFAIERNINGSWEQVTFIVTQASGGNSDAVLSYQFIDLNNTKGISQYRIKQVDFDSKSKYSEIRSVKGDGQIGKLIAYPNPSADGRVNIVFDDATVTRSISVTDMSGRTVKQINSITNNNITIDNLQPGIYSLRVFVPETGEQSVIKVVINKR